jgi:hypothetical protein
MMHEHSSCYLDVARWNVGPGVYMASVCRDELEIMSRTQTIDEYVLCVGACTQARLRR